MVGFGSTGGLPHYQDVWVMLAMEDGTHLDSWFWFGAEGEKEGHPIWMVGFGSTGGKAGQTYLDGWVWLHRREGRANLSGWLGLAPQERRKGTLCG